METGEPLPTRLCFLVIIRSSALTTYWHNRYISIAEQAIFAGSDSSVCKFAASGFEILRLEIMKQSVL